jgi:hypothetical protein
MKTLVITGGPCAGKTKVLGLLKEEYGDRVLFVPEPASMLIGGGFPVPEHLPHLRAFQSCVYHLHSQLEEVYQMQAEREGKSLVLCDRGRLDGAAFLPGGEEEFQELFGATPEDLYEHYDGVLHFESLATFDKEKYQQKYDDGIRHHNVEEAAEAEMLLRTVWNRHPNWTFLEGAMGVRGKFEYLSELIDGILHEEG